MRLPSSGDRLPNGDLTKSVEQYVETWRAYTDPVVALFPGAARYSFDPGLTIRIGTGRLEEFGPEVLAELARLAQRVQELERALRDLLASADASWENSGSKSGHDWADACKSARTALEPKP